VHLDLLTLITELLEVISRQAIDLRIGALVVGWCSSWCSTTLDHLDWDAATEGTGTGSVLALNHADVVLSSDVTSASLASWDLSREREIGHGVGPVVAVGALNLGGDVDVGPVAAGTVSVDLASVWASAVTVDLVKGHVDGATSRDLGKRLSGVLGHDSLGACDNVVLTTSEGLTASSGVVTLEAGGILLEGVPSGSITGSGWVNSNSGASTALITNCLDDRTVAGHQLGNGEETESDWEMHPEPAGILY